jgi:hypothetical protein
MRMIPDISLASRVIDFPYKLVALPGTAPSANHRLADKRFKWERPQLHIIWTTGPSVLPYGESE